MKHILLVDDEPEVLEGLLLMLEHLEDVCLHTAQLAVSALEIMDTTPISLIIADIHMPGMNGIEMWEEIHRRTSGCRVIFLSGVRDFDNVYRVIQSPNARFLTKMEPEERIIAVVKEALSELDLQAGRQVEQQQRTLYKYITDKHQESSDTLLACLLEMDRPLRIRDGMNYAVFTGVYAWTMNEHEKQEIISSLCTAIERKLSDVARCLVPINSSHVLLLTQAGSMPERNFVHVLQEICSCADQICAVYGMDTSVAQVRNCFCQISQTIIPRSGVRSYASLAEDEYVSHHETWKQISFNLQLLNSYIMLGQKENFCDLTGRMLDACLQPKLDIDQLTHVYYGILAMLLQRLSHLDANDLQQQLKKEFLQAPRRSQDWQSARERLLLYSTEIFKLLFPPNPYSPTDIVAGIQCYIRDHLDQDLSLNALSIRFNMNPNYLSRFFRDNTGHKLHDYITDMRLGTAERLLRSSNRKINEIAHCVGYDSSHTFIRAFRRQFGCTPADYRIKKSTEN